MKKGIALVLFVALLLPGGVLFADETPVIEAEIDTRTYVEVAIDIEDIVTNLEVEGGFLTQIRKWQMDDNAGDVVRSVITLSEIEEEGGFGITFRKGAQKRIVYSEVTALVEKIESFEDREKITTEVADALLLEIVLLFELVDAV